MLKFIKGYRLYEALLMTGFFIIGSFFGINLISVNSIGLLIISAIISLLVVLSVYSYNAAAGKSTDKNNPRLNSLNLITKKSFQLSGITFSLLAIATSAFLSLEIALVCTFVNIIWIGYSHPKYGLKYKPYFGTILHFFAQIIQFNMCYLIFDSIDLYSIALSLYFALAFSTGHLHHEIIDFESDKAAGFRTTTIKHGITKVKNTIIAICTFNLFIVLLLHLFTIVNLISFIIMIVPIIIHILLYLIFNKTIAIKAIQIRSFYRLIYFSCFAVFIVYKIITLY